MSELSDEESRALKALLRKAGYQIPNDGYSAALMAESPKSGNDDKGFECVSMSDASKRRLAAVDEPPKDDDGQSLVKKMFSSPAGGKAVSKPKLPPGVEDLDQWGRTVMEKGKYAKNEYTYEELRSHTDQAVQAYVSWLCDHLYSQMHAQFHDFVNYVNMVKVQTSSSTGAILIPGSRQIRKFK